MAINPVSNQGYTPLTGAEKAAAADPLKNKQQAGTAKPSEAASVEISDAAKKRAEEAQKQEAAAEARKKA
jgi:hypothetical protein